MYFKDYIFYDHLPTPRCKRNMWKLPKEEVPNVSTRISINLKPSNYSRYVITSGAPEHPAEYDEPNGGTPNERCKYNTKHFDWKYQ